LEFWFLVDICLVIPMISNIFCPMHYTAVIDLVFSSIEYIMKDVTHGWLIRYIHTNNAFMFL